MSIPARVKDIPAASTIEDVLIRGDLSKLTEQQRTEYYMRICQSIGLNPMTQPFQYLTLNGKLVLYARRDCADQLRKINGISIEIVSQEKADGLLTIHVRAKDMHGRTDEDLGVVAFSEALKGEVAANAILKAVTKAKRRVTLSISGLGFLDETEVADIPEAAKQVEPQKQTRVEPHWMSIPTFADGSLDYRSFGAQLVTNIRAAEDKQTIFSWLELNKPSLEQMKKDAPKMHANFLTAIGDATHA